MQGKVSKGLPTKLPSMSQGGIIDDISITGCQVKIRQALSLTISRALLVDCNPSTTLKISFVDVEKNWFIVATTKG